MGTVRDPGDTKPTQPRDPKMQVARILLPDGVYKEFEVNKTAEGDVLFTQVTQNLSIEEREYFSLCFYDNVEGVRHWLYNDKVIAKQIKSLPWEFSFEVKFYPTTPTTIVDDHARYFVFLQLRRDILTGRLPVANADTHALLGSFVAQMEFGDAPSHISTDYEKFITDSKLVPSSHATPETFKKIAELHRELRGQSTGETEIMFLDHCKHLPLYGIHIFKATDKDKKSVDVGIGAAGVNIYQDEQVAHIFNWQNIIKIGYKRTYFSVKVKAGVLENVKDEKTLYYKLPSYVAAKRVWKCAVEHHTFFRLIQPEEKPHKGFFNFGSQRFRYQGRTQFQTKIASQMFDKPSTVDRAPSAMSQPIASAEDQKLQTLNLTDSELEQRQFEVSSVSDIACLFFVPNFPKESMHVGILIVALFCVLFYVLFIYLTTKLTAFSHIKNQKKTTNFGEKTRFKKPSSTYIYTLNFHVFRIFYRIFSIPSSLF
ncbi:CBN-FRM-1 protein [Caenorhabditis brenneri]|uniref:CBN-FRM-1 protein n=1 Tax=Caenorhabditis brenneri TaxID=135651 RepID=G0NZM5_CAEBE|nr:CBN-FRM-1 protein [Caenorhabditis brenneri]